MKAAWRRYWFEMPALPTRMVLLRVLFFGLLGFDQWFMLVEHAPRYGAGGFNVPQIDLLDRLLPVPTPAIVTALWLVGGFLALRAAIGVAVRTSIIGACVCYFGVYLWSQADSYQHHYLVGLLLVLFAITPEPLWTPPPKAEREPAPPASWTLRLVYVQLALLYFWAAVTKLTPVWLDGSTLKQLLHSPTMLSTIGGVLHVFGVPPDGTFVALAWSTVLLELAAAAMYLTRRFTFLGMIALPLFHVSIEVFDFDIEWFSYYMMALNLVLLMPDRWVQALERPVDAVRARLAALRARVPAGTGSGAAMGLALVTGAACAALAYVIPLEGRTDVAVLVFFVVAAAQWPWDEAAARRAVGRSAAHVALAGAMVASMFGSSVPYDYYRLWAGDLKRRGDLTGSIALYERANSLAGPGPARHFALGRLYENTGRLDDARAAYEEDVRRQEAALREDLERARRSSGDADPLFDLAERDEDLAERCDQLAKLLRRTGSTADADRFERQALTYREDARTSRQQAQLRDPSVRGRRAGGSGEP